MDLQDLKAILQEVPQVEVLVGQSNFIRWRREFLELLENQGLKSLVVPISKPTTDNPDAMDVEEEIHENPGAIPNANNADGTAKAINVYKIEIEIYKFRLHTYEEQQKRIRKAHHYLKQSLDRSIRSQIVGMTLSNAWIYLSNSFGMSCSMAQQILYRQLKAIDLADYKTVQEYISEHRNIVNDLVSVEGALPDTQLKSKLLDNLTDAYTGLVTNVQYEEGLGQTLSLDQIVTRLLSWESMLKHRNAKKASNSGNGKNGKNDKSDKGHNKNNKSNSDDSSGKTEKKRCPRCKMTSHTSIDECWFENPHLAPEGWKPKKKDGKSGKRDDKTASVASLSAADIQLFREFIQSNSKTTSPGRDTPTLSSHSFANLASQVASSLIELAEGGNDRESETTGDEGIELDGIFESNGFQAMAAGNFDAGTWIVDSGANLHVVNDAKWFDELKDFSVIINTANNQGPPLTVAGGGTVRIHLVSKSGEPHEITLHNVAYAPAGRCNLLSIGLLANENNIKSTFTNKEVTFESADKEIGYATCQNRLYHLKLGSTGPHNIERQAALVDVEHPVIQWHRKLGHLGMGSLLKLHPVVKGMDNITEKQIKAFQKFICPICATTKSLVRIPKDPAHRTVNSPGEMIHVDTWGPYPIPGYDGTTRFLFFTDQCTRFTWCERLNGKQSLDTVFKGLHRYIEKAHGVEIRNYRFDNEFNSRDIGGWLRGKGIGVENTESYAHYQNGTAEAQNRRIRERAAAMIQENNIMDKYKNIFVEKGIELMRTADLPEKLWPEAIERAVWLRNRSPARALKKKEKKTPWEALYDSQPVLSHEAIWGSRTYVSIPHEKRGKKLHDRRGWIGYFLGFETEAMYRIYDPQCDKVVRVGRAAIRIDQGEGLDDRQDAPSHRDRVGDQSAPPTGKEGQEIDEPPSDEDDNEVSEADEDQAQTNFLGMAIEEVDNSESEDSDSIRPPPKRTINSPIKEEDEDEEQRRTTEMIHRDLDFFERFRANSDNNATDDDDQGTTSEQEAWAEIGLAKLRPMPKEIIPSLVPSAYNTVGKLKYEPSKCEPCFVARNVCDVQTVGKPCTACQTRRRHCREQRRTVQRAMLDPRRIHEYKSIKRKASKPKFVRPTKGVEKDKKCHACLKTGLACNGEFPCNNCPGPRQRNKCMSQEDWRRVETEPTCEHCRDNPPRFCDRKRPCGTCTRRKKDCTYRDQEGAVFRRYLVSGAAHRAQPHYIEGPNTKNPDEAELVVDTLRCINCRLYNRNCNRGEPCYSCIKALANNKSANAFCTYFVNSSSSESWAVSGWIMDEQGNPHLKDGTIYTRTKIGIAPNRPTGRLTSEKKTISDIISKQRPVPATEQDNGPKEAFFRAFPTGWEAVYTPSRGHLCGLHAISISMGHQHPNLPQPTLSDLQGLLPFTSIKDKVNFADDQLANLIETYGEQHDIKFQLGYKATGMDPILVPRRDGNDGLDVVRVWIHNEITEPTIPGALNHWEGIRQSNRRGKRPDKPAQSSKAPVKPSEAPTELPDMDGEEDRAKDDSENPDGDSESDGDITRRRTNTTDDLIRDDDSDSDSDVDDSIMRRRMNQDDDLVDDSYDTMTSIIAQASIEGPEQGEEFLPDPSLHEELLHNPEPRTYAEAMKGPEAKFYQHAFDKEVRTLQNDKVFEIVDEPEGENIITSKMVLTRKIGPDHKIRKYKGRMCARGFQQVEGIDYTETYASTVKPTSVLIMFAIATIMHWKVYQMDVVLAFLNAKLKKPIYMRPPKGMKVSKGKVLKLLSTLYGLKQSAREWYELVKEEMEKLGFRVSEHDPCVFIKDDPFILVLIWVDDFLVTGPEDDALLGFQSQISNRFKMTDEGECKFYLGMQIDRSPGKTIIHQRAYVEQMLRRYGLETTTPVGQPLNPNTKYEKHSGPPDKDLQYEFQSKIGSLNHLANRTRPDISFSTGFMGRFAASPDRKHVDGATDIIRYTSGNKSLGIKYESTGNNITDLQPLGFSDSDFAGCEDTRKSTTGWIFTMAGGPISWSSKRQSLVTLSTLEAEYVASSEAAREAVWIRNFINSLRIPNVEVGPIPIFKVEKIPLSIDNDGALRLTKNPEMHSRSKHIDVKYHYVREQVNNGVIETQRVDTKDNLADILTKPLGGQTMKPLIRKMGMVEGEVSEEQGEQDSLSDDLENQGEQDDPLEDPKT